MVRTERCSFALVGRSRGQDVRVNRRIRLDQLRLRQRLWRLEVPAVFLRGRVFEQHAPTAQFVKPSCDSLNHSQIPSTNAVDALAV